MTLTISFSFRRSSSARISPLKLGSSKPSTSSCTESVPSVPPCHCRGSSVQDGCLVITRLG